MDTVHPARRPLALLLACALAFAFSGIPQSSAHASERGAVDSLDIDVPFDSTDQGEDALAAKDAENRSPHTEDEAALSYVPAQPSGNGPASFGATSAVSPLSAPTTQAELQQALIDASDGAVIELSQDIEIDGNGMAYDQSTGWVQATNVPLYIPNNLASVTIDGNGHRLVLADGYEGLHIDAESYPSGTRAIALVDLSLIGHNENIDSSTALGDRKAGGGMHVGGSKTTLAWNNVTMAGVHGIGTGGGLVSYGANVTLTDCTISDVSATGNGGFYTSDAGGINYNGSLTVSGGTVSGARSGGNGGFALVSGGTHTFIGVSFDDCSAADSGGVISNARGGASTYIVTSCAFTGNSAGESGGAIQSQKGGHTITDSTFTNNAAGTSSNAYLGVGGAFYQNSATQSTYSAISGCTFTGNTAKSGGAVYGQGFDFSNVRFIGNSALAGSGGALNCNPNTYYTIDGAYFEDNYASAGQLNWNIEKPMSAIGSGLVFSDLANHYRANVKNVTGLTAQAPDAMVAPSNCLNNYDISTYAFSTYFYTGGTGAVWSDTGLDKTRMFSVGTRTISAELEKRGLTVSHEDGKRLLGWYFPIGEVTSSGQPIVFEGYGDKPYVISNGINDDLLKAQGFDASEIVDGSTYVIQGSFHVLVPLWEDQADLVYHPDSSTQITDPDGPHGMLTETAVKDLAGLDAETLAPENMELVGWALTEHEVAGETLYAPGANIVVETDDLLDGEVHLYARYGEADTSVELSVARLYGEHRYATSRQVSTYERGTENTVILASGDDYHFPDALTASALSGNLGNAPIVLTPTDLLADDARAAIESDLQAGTVIIIGDQNAVSSEVEASVRALSSVATVERIGGADRYETAELVNRKIGSSRSTTAIIARADDFPDSLSASSWSAVTQSPIFLAKSGSAGLTEGTKEALASGGFDRVLVLGDENSVSAATLKEAQAAAGLTDAQVVRLGGTDRYHTSSLVAEWTTSDERSAVERLSWNKPALARGDKHADSLTGGALQGRDRSPVLLTSGTSASSYALALLAANDGTVAELRFFGNEYAISLDTSKALIKALTWDSILWKPNDDVAFEVK